MPTLSFEEDVRNELQDIISATWTDLAITMRGHGAERIDWRIMLEKLERGKNEGSHPGSFDVPFAVIEFGDLQPTSDYSDNFDHYYLQVTIFKIISMRVEEGALVVQPTYSELEASLMEAGELLRKGLLADTIVNFFATEATSSYSTAIPPNAYFIKNKHPLMAVQVSAKLICGESWR
jgi:hypothetical protein